MVDSSTSCVCFSGFTHDTLRRVPWLITVIVLNRAFINLSFVAFIVVIYIVYFDFNGKTQLVVGGEVTPNDFTFVFKRCNMIADFLPFYLEKT